MQVRWMAALSVGGLLLIGRPAWAQGPPLDFFSVTPCRVLDTRLAAQGPALASGASRLVAVPGGSCGIPPVARAVAANITAVASTGVGNLRLYPGDGTVPSTSALNFGAGQTRANNGVFALAGNGNGTLAIFAAVAGGGTVHAVLDVTGYFASADVFVSPSGNDGSPGTCAQPLLTIQAAIDLAASLGRNVAVTAGTYNEPSTIALADGVSVLGGFAPDCTWPGTPLPQIFVANSTAVSANGLTTPTTLDLVSIQGAGNPVIGGSAYGVVAVGSPGLRIQRSTIIAGRGGDGANGANGAVGADGGIGGAGNSGCEDSGGFCGACNRPAGGSGGTSSVGRAGGVGGQPGHGDLAGASGGTGVVGTPGGAGGFGGGGGHGQPGTAGAAGVPGTDGAGGADFGSTSGTLYSPAGGTDGGAGTHGNGGGGGGGGGGGNDACDSYGSSGGGGGAGGGAGGPGIRGTGAGGSFSAYLMDSDVTIASSTLQTAGGGTGGSGGSGGPRGLGGSAGPGGPYGGGGEQDDGGNGAEGGAGGAGGGGGHGGGGGGGPSVGVVIVGSSSPTLTSNTFSLGPGGAGGTSAGSPGSPGLQAQTLSGP